MDNYIVLFAWGVLLGCLRWPARRALATRLPGRRWMGARATLGAIFALVLAAGVLAKSPSNMSLGEQVPLFLAALLGYFGALFWLARRM